MNIAASSSTTGLRNALQVWALGCLLVIAAAFMATQARAQVANESIDAALINQVREMALVASQQSRVSSNGTGSPLRFDVTVGALDSRLKLAACQRIEPYLPPGTRLWGKARIGLRCTQGERPWNVYLPITVHVYGQTLVASQPLPLGTTVQAGDLTFAEIDLAEENSPAIVNEALAIGRVLTRSLLAGQGIRQADLRARQWFAAGDTVKVMARGNGFSVSGSGTALSPGLEGQAARVRTDSGQIITGTPVAAREMEIIL
jgi:flagella basal body P-ring formation protein FlgA